MGTIVRSHTFSSGEILTSDNLNGEIDNILATVNGQINVANLTTLTSPKLATSVLDSNSNELLLLTATGSAVNEITLANAATNNSPSLTASGGDANVDLTLAGKGTGKVIVTGDLQISGDDLFMTTNTAGHLLIGDGTNYNPTALSGDVTVNGSGVTAIGAVITTSQIAAGTLVLDSEGIASNDNNTTLPTSAAVKDYVDTQIGSGDTIAELNDTDIGSLSGGHVLIYDGSNSWDNKALSGDATIAASGAITIADAVIDNDNISGSAAIADSKLATITTGNKVSGSAVQLASTSALEDSTGLQIKAATAGTGLSLASQVLSVDAAQTQITSVGTIGTGAWEATDVAVAHGGTGASSAGDARTNLGLVIGTNVQAYDAGLASVAGLTTAANKMIYTSGSDTYAVADLSVFARTILDDADAGAVRTTIGAQASGSYQTSDAGLTSIAGLTTAADKMIYTSGSDTYAVADLSSFARTILDDADAAAVRTTIGAQAAGSFAALGANSDITSLTGLTTDLAVAHGGTGAGTFTTSGILLGAGTSAITASAAMTTNGTLLIGGTGGPEVATLTAGSNVTITNGDGTISIAAASGGGGATNFTDLSDVGSTTATAGRLMVADGDSWESVAVSGDATLASSGALTVSSAATATNVTVSANNSGDEDIFPTFVDGATGAQGIETDTGFTYNPSSGTLTISGELDAATLDLSGSADIAGDLTLSAGADGALRFSVASSVKILDNSATSLVIEEADNAYMTFVTTDSSEAIKFDKALDINAAMQIDSTITVGANDQGYDVIFYGDTASANMTWDTSADDLILSGAAGLVVPDGQLPLGSTAVTTTAAELNLIDGGTARGTDAVASGDGILINDGGTMKMTNVDTVSTYFAAHNVGGSNIATVGTVTSGTFSGVLDGTVTMTVGSDAEGDMYYRASSGYLTRLPAGADGYVLTGTGAGSVPAWEAAAAASTFNSDANVANGYGFTVGAAASDRATVNGVLAETQILGTGDADSAMVIGRWGANASSALLYMVKSRGGSIGGAGSELNDNDRIGQIIFCGDDSTDYQVAAGRMWCEVDVGTVSENVLGGAVCISTNDGGSGSGDTERFRIHANGNFTGSSSADISDSRLKENVATLSGSLAKINQLRGIEFTWKAEAKKDTDKHYGFLAQEVESIIPTVVWDKSVHDITAQAATTYTDGDTIPDGKSIGDVKTAAIEGKAFKSLHYSGLIPVLVEAIKELTARVEALEA